MLSTNGLCGRDSIINRPPPYSWNTIDIVRGLTTKNKQIFTDNISNLQAIKHSVNHIESWLQRDNAVVSRLRTSLQQVDTAYYPIRQSRGYLRKTC